jgi:hypothetical protein
MINDNELNKLEESADMRHLLKEVQAMRDEENAQCTPPPFDSLMKRMKEKETPRTIPFPTKKRTSISPWWLVAACLTGLCLGIAMPRPWEEKSTLLLSSHLHKDTIDTSLGESLTQEGFPLHLIVSM